jgi:putative endonuclease
MPREYNFYVYILASRSRTLYIGLTNNLARRLEQHHSVLDDGFTARYNINRLVYLEHHQYIRNAIAREKELKKWSRSKKIELVEKDNPTWLDLSA